MQQFTVIAGPNGAGKCSFSALLSPVNAFIFDPDLQKAKISHNYPDIAGEAVETALTNEYQLQEELVLNHKFDFTAETNFRNTFLASRARHFKSRGYITTLIFIMLPRIEHSIERVNLRVKRKGHFVDLDSIRVNFEMSWVNFKNWLNDFDNIILMHGSKQDAVNPPDMLLVFKSGILWQKNQSIPHWANNRVNEIEALMAK